MGQNRAIAGLCKLLYRMKYFLVFQSGVKLYQTVIGVCQCQYLAGLYLLYDALFVVNLISTVKLHCRVCFFDLLCHFRS